MKFNHAIDSYIQECSGDLILDLMTVEKLEMRRDFFYDALGMGFYHMPPRMMQRPDTLIDRECAIRVPLKTLSRSRFHFRVAAQNADLSIQTKTLFDIDDMAHSELAFSWHQSRWSMTRQKDSDNILEDYWSELCRDKDKIIEFYDPTGIMIGACMLGIGHNSLGEKIAHAFYFYYDSTSMKQRQPGYAMLFTIIDELKRSGFDYFYPGIFKPNSEYSYKADIAPNMQRYNNGSWETLPEPERGRRLRIHPDQSSKKQRFALKLV